MSSREAASRSPTAPAFYALGPGGWRDYVTLLHLPYTAWHLAYVVVGGCLVTSVAWGRLGLTVLAFFLAMGVAAHALDELDGRPLSTTIPARTLVVLAAVSLAGAAAIGVVVAVRTTSWILPLVALGALLVPAYNLEWFGGRVHTDLGFALSWGAFPVVTAYVAQAGAIRVDVVLAAGWATLLSLAQRALSTPVRRLRRNIVEVGGHLMLADGSREQLDRSTLVAAPERALRLLGASAVAAAAMLAASHLAL